MRHFLLKCSLFALLQAAGFSLLLSRYEVTRETNFLAATVDKHRRLRSLPAGRILLVGGSNVPFGFESERLERELGRPVVNMGLAAGLGLEFMLAEIEPQLREGDLVVLSLEYDHFARGTDSSRWGGAGFDPSVLQQVLIFRPEGVFALGLTHVPEMVLERGLRIFGEVARRSFMRWWPSRRAESEASASRANAPGLAAGGRTAPEPGEQGAAALGFNVWGDYTIHRGAAPRAEPEAVRSLALVSDVRGFPSQAALAVLREFVARTRPTGVQVTFSFAPKAVSTIFREGALAASLAQRLREISGLEVLDTPEDHAYPAEQFFDTANHLTAEGAAARTTKLIRALQRVVGDDARN